MIKIKWTDGIKMVDFFQITKEERLLLKIKKN
jgi:hypothetical protein